MSTELAVSADGWSVAVVPGGQALPAMDDASWSPVVFPHSRDVPEGHELVYRVEVSAHDPDAETCRDLTLSVIGEGETFSVDREDLQVGRVGQQRVLTLPRHFADGQPHVLGVRIPGGGVVGVCDYPSFQLRQRFGISWWQPGGGAVAPLSVQVCREDDGVSLLMRTCLENRYELAREGALYYELLDAEGAVLERSEDYPIALDDRERTLREDRWVLQELPDWWPHRPTTLFVRATVLGPGGTADHRLCPVPLAQYRFSGHTVSVNGRPAFWRGVELDVSMPGLGRNVSGASIERDLLRVRAAGFLFVVSDRSDALFLDACDRVGVAVVWRGAPDELAALGDGVRTAACHSGFAGVISADRAACSELFAQYGCGNRLMVVPPDELPVYRLEGVAVPDAIEGLGRTYVRFQRGAGDLVLQEQVDLIRVLVNEHYGAGVSGNIYRVFADDNEQGFDLTGMVDAWRNPKPVAHFMRSLLTPAERGAFVHIAQPWIPGAERRLQVFSNCRVISLRLNGEIVDTKKSDVGDGNASLPFAPFTFALPEFVAGRLEAIGYIDDEEVATHARTSPGDAHALILEVDDQGIPFEAGGADAVCVRATLCDERGQTVPDSMQEVKFSVAGAGQLLGENPAPIEAGIATVLVRSRKAAGEVVITALAAGVQEAKLTLVST